MTFLFFQNRSHDNILPNSTEVLILQMLQNNSISNLDCKEIGSTFVIKCLHAAESAFAEDLNMLSPFYTGFLILFAVLLGLLIGSFLNVCIYRLPLRETIVRGHSYCPRCRHPLAGADLVPVSAISCWAASAVTAKRPSRRATPASNC